MGTRGLGHLGYYQCNTGRGRARPEQEWNRMIDAETYVLIAGGGPVGLTAAIELGWRGVPAVLVNDNLDTVQHPKCNSTNARSMEHFRRLALVPDLRAAALPADLPRATAYVTRFCGAEFARMARPRVDWPTPESPVNISQIRLERVLRAQAECALGGRVHFGWKLLRFDADDKGVVAQVESQAGDRREIKARYLFGIDGAGSMVRKALGITLQGEDGSASRAFMGGTMVSYYIRAPGLVAASRRMPAHMTLVINPELRAMMYAQDAREHWVVHYQVPPGVDWSTVDARAMVRAVIGADVDFDILSGGPWIGGLALVADRYRAGPVFLAGDAAHLFTPLGGLGMNTGIGDVMNLGWKIAAHYRGWAGAGLLDTYEQERRPIGLRNVQLGVACTKVMDGWTVGPDFEADSPEAQMAREEFGARIVAEDRAQYLTVGIQLGERYEGSPIVCPDGTPVPPDPWDRYDPIDRPGSRAPHVRLGPKHALFDEFGPGFTLIDFAGVADTSALEDAARSRGVPLKILPLPDAPDNPYTQPLVLVRPDGHVAWHGDELPDPLALIDRIRGAAGFPPPLAGEG